MVREETLSILVYGNAGGNPLSGPVRVMDVTLLEISCSDVVSTANELAVALDEAVIAAATASSLILSGYPSSLIVRPYGGRRGTSAQLAYEVARFYENSFALQTV